MARTILIISLLFFLSCASNKQAHNADQNAYDMILRNGTIYDGSGGDPYIGDIAIKGDTIAAIGANLPGHGSHEIDATGLAVAPGFVNMLSWATDSLIGDGHSESDIRQGVTLEVMGEGNSMGPLNEAMKKEA